MNPTITLTIAALKMYFRNRSALFFAMFLPVLIMAIFGLFNFGSFSEIELRVVDQAQNGVSSSFIQALESSDVIELSRSDRESAIEALEEGELDIVVVIPGDFGAQDKPVTLRSFQNQSRPQQAQVGEAVISRVLDEMAFALSGTPKLFSLETTPVQGRNLRYIDFLVPGVIAMSIMQIGIFSVTFSLVQFRQQGVLRRLKAAPINPLHFLVGQVATRLIVSILQTLVLLGMGIILFGVHVEGNVGYILFLALFGGALFLSVGFAVSGFARTEEVAAPLANIIALPMMFLSGVFFPRDGLPQVLQNITDYLPLTFLADGMRQVSIDGADLTHISGSLLGLGVWLLFSFFIAVRLFRWE